MDDHEDGYGVSWGQEIVPTTSGASNKEILKHTKEYSSFHLDGIMYQVHDTVCLKASEGPPYIAKILSMYENVKKKEKRMSVRWFCRACELPVAVAGVNYRDSKEIYMSWGGGSKNVVNPASTIEKCTVVCTAPLEWNDPRPTRELIAAAAHSFSYAFHTKLLKVVSLNLVVTQFGEEYVKGSGLRSSHVNPTNGGSRRKTLEPGTKAAARVTPSDQGNSQPAGRASAGPSRLTSSLEDDMEVTHKKARVDRPNLVEGSRPIRELIAEANNKKKRLTVNSLDPNPEPGSLERPVVSDSSPIGLGERLKNVSSDPKSDPGIFKRSSVRPTLIGLGEILKNVSSIYKSNETSKFAGKRVAETELKRKQMQDPGFTPSPGFIKMPWHKALELALEKGRALLLQNLDPGFSSCEIETMLTELLRVSCEARITPPKDFSCYTSGDLVNSNSPSRCFVLGHLAGEALVLFQSRVEAEEALLKLTENVLIWSKDQRPVVASLATKQRHEINPFHGFLNLAQFNRTNAESETMGGATSHCSQPNTVVFEMGLQWRLLQEQHTKAWELSSEPSDSQPHLLGTERKDLVHGFS